MRSDRERSAPAVKSNFWDEVSALVPIQTYAAGQTVFSVGEPGNAMYVIRSGCVQVTLHSADGRKTGINRMGAGEMLGEIAFLDKGPRTADVIATEPTTLAVIDRAIYRDKLQANGAFLEVLVDTLCTHIRNATEVLETISSPSAAVRLARCLHRLSQKWGEQVEDNSNAQAIHISQEELAAFSGLTRQCVNQTLSGWQRQGLVKTQRGRIVISDPSALLSLCEA